MQVSETGKLNRPDILILMCNQMQELDKNTYRPKASTHALQALSGYIESTHGFYYVTDKPAKQQNMGVVTQMAMDFLKEPVFPVSRNGHRVSMPILTGRRLLLGKSKRPMARFIIHLVQKMKYWKGIAAILQSDLHYMPLIRSYV